MERVDLVLQVLSLHRIIDGMSSREPSRNCRKLLGRKLFGLITCGSVCSQVSATLVIDVRERFSSVAFRPCSFLEEVLGVQCRLREGRAVQVVLRVVDWKREGEVGDQQGG